MLVRISVKEISSTGKEKQSRVKMTLDLIICNASNCMKVATTFYGYISLLFLESDTYCIEDLDDD